MSVMELNDDTHATMPVGGGSLDGEACLSMLRQMSSQWWRRAQVKEEEMPVELMFDRTRDDFLPELLPFNEHPDFWEAPPELRSRALSCGWIAYNEKTIAIESQIIGPACIDLLYRRLPGADEASIRATASETLTDEAYHILLTNNAVRACEDNRDLRLRELPEFALVREMEREMASHSEKWQRHVVQLATAIVSEVFISDYLAQLSSARHIQPLNRLTVEAHRRDELAHSKIFRSLAARIYHSLSEREKAFFVEVLPKPVRWFADQELDVWQSMLAQIDFPGYEGIIRDCRNVAQWRLDRLDYSELEELADELGILDSQHGVDSFGRAGLLRR
ncbi:diiron oxygenase [Arhodomonas sp. AD133]|uniref:diiron oxygenase n=1 Tax=Arhodomonas sp. AD133 TaxID=3415009 RepID=UPI003EB885F8